MNIKMILLRIAKKTLNDLVDNEIKRELDKVLQPDITAKVINIIKKQIDRI